MLFLLYFFLLIFRSLLCQFKLQNFYYPWCTFSTLLSWLRVRISYSMFPFERFVYLFAFVSESHQLVYPLVNVPSYIYSSIQPFIQAFCNICWFSLRFFCCFCFLLKKKKIILIRFLIWQKLLFCCSCNYNRLRFYTSCQRWGVRTRGVHKMCGTAGNVAFNIRIFNWSCQERRTG